VLSPQSAEVGAPNRDSKSVAYENCTKSAKCGGLETNGPRERISGVGRCVAVRRFVREARRYWRFQRAKTRGERWSRKDWRRERNCLPTVFANRVVVCKPLQALPFGQENGWQDSLFAPRSAPRPPQGGVRNGNRCINLLESVLVTNHGGSGRPLDDVTRPLRPAGRIRRNGSLAY
jgi:hypothetical protein